MCSPKSRYSSKLRNCKVLIVSDGEVSSKQPEFGGAKGDVGSTIVSVLEVAESDFTSLLAESEADESSAQEAYDKLTQENAVRQKRPSQSHHFFSNLPLLPTDSNGCNIL